MTDSDNRCSAATVDDLQAQARKLSPHDQYRLAFFIAENVGYVLAKEIDFDAEPQRASKFSINKRDEMRQLAEHLEQYRLSDPHIGPDDCDLIVAALRGACSVTRPNQLSPVDAHR
jgi:hypothetical protein